MDTEEEWRPVLGFEGIYEVSSFGQVRRSAPAARNGKGRGGGAQIGRILKGGKSGEYRSISLWKGGVPHSRLVHVMVAEAFLPARPSAFHEVNHSDGVKLHNVSGNLEWMTRSENMIHAYQLGLRPPIDVEKARANRPFCRNGHEFTPDNTWLKKGVHRTCRICHRTQNGKSRKRMKEAS